MSNLTLIDETAEFVWAREKDDLRAMAIIAMLGSGTQLYGAEPLFNFYDRTRCAVETQQYGLLYQRTDAEAPVAMPVSFISWALLSKPVEAIFTNRMRPLGREEWKSGKHLWVIDNIAPYAESHFIQTRVFMETLFSDYPVFNYTDVRSGTISRKTMQNRKYVQVD